MSALTTEQATALIEAIRAFTVEAPGGRPNGKAEAALAELGRALGGDGTKACVGAARLAFRNLCEAMANDTQTLRIAAEGYFGGDFRKPGARP